MSERDENRLRRLQKRLNDALVESSEEGEQRLHSYVDYGLGALQARLLSAAESGGIEEVLQEFERQAADEGRPRARSALLRVLVNTPNLLESGLHVPSLQERAPWKLRPSHRTKDA